MGSNAEEVERVGGGSNDGNEDSILRGSEDVDGAVDCLTPTTVEEVGDCEEEANEDNIGEA